MEEIGLNRLLVNFRLFYLVAHVISIIIFILVSSWVGIHLGGLAWTSNPSIQFNWHPILMTLGMVILYGNSILLYRGFRYHRKRPLKISHALVHSFAFLFTVIALVAAFDSHNLAAKPIPNLYSLHSWIGLAAVILFAMQFVVGFVTFLFPTLKEPIRETVMPAHIFFGITGFVMAIGACLLGLTEKAIFHIGVANIASLPSEELLVNCIGCLLVVYGILVVYLVTEKNYKRQPLPEDTMLLGSGSIAGSRSD